MLDLAEMLWVRGRLAEVRALEACRRGCAVRLYGEAYATR